eukprot:1933093-Prymnesium_polylepis.1
MGRQRPGSASDGPCAARRHPQHPPWRPPASVSTDLQSRKNRVRVGCIGASGVRRMTAAGGWEVNEAYHSEAWAGGGEPGRV